MDKIPAKAKIYKTNWFDEVFVTNTFDLANSINAEIHSVKVIRGILIESEDIQ